jgi:hypothetical protein
MVYIHLSRNVNFPIILEIWFIYFCQETLPTLLYYRYGLHTFVKKHYLYYYIRDIAYIHLSRREYITWSMFSINYKRPYLPRFMWYYPFHIGMLLSMTKLKVVHAGSLKQHTCSKCTFNLLASYLLHGDENTNNIG